MVCEANLIVYRGCESFFTADDTAVKVTDFAFGATINAGF